MRAIKIIGSSHIAKQSMDEIQEYILEEKPEIVALELDAIRFRNLFRRARKTRLRDYRGMGLFGGLFGLIGSLLQKKLGSKVGANPGIDMKAAAIAARKVGAKVFLIDRDLRITLHRLSRNITGWEKAKLAFYFLFGGFSRENRAWLKKIDLTKVPSEELIVAITNQLKRKFPKLHKILVGERNQIMANNLKYIHKQFPAAKIVAVVGAGHKRDIEQLLEN